VAGWRSHGFSPGQLPAHCRDVINPSLVRLSLAPAAWRDRVEVAAIDMCSIYLSAVRRALPKAQVAVDLFHVVQLAVKTAGDVRRRATRERYGRRGRSGDPEYRIKNLLARNLEHLTAEQFGKIIDTLDGARPEPSPGNQHGR
jgi:transposase